MKDLSLRNLPKLAIAAGASTPAAVGGTFVESTTENAILFWDVGSTTWKKLSSTTDSNNLPAGGSTGQFIKKNSATDFDTVWSAVTKTDVGLANVDNTSDANKPVSSATQTALNAKEGTIAAGTTAQFWRGDKSWQDLALNVRATVLTGLSTATNAVIAAADTTIVAFGKLQAQITGHFGVGGATHPDGTTTVAGFISTADKIKLDGVATGATANSSDATLLARASHTGTQTASTISDFSAAVAATASVTANTAKVTNATHTGDVTGATALTIAANVVTNTKLADMATSTIKGRVTASTGDPEDLSAAQVKTILSLSNVDNTSDANKPISTATQTALDGKLGNSTPQTLTVNSTSPALTISQSGTGDALIVEDVASDTTPFVIDKVGNLVVGWPSTTLLGVTADNGGLDAKYAINIAGSLQNTSGLAMSMWGNSVANQLGPQLIGAKSRTESGIGVHGSVLGNDRLLKLIGEGSDGTQFIRGASIALEADADFTTDSAPGRITFAVTPSGGTVPLPAMSIKSTKDVVLGSAALAVGATAALPWFPSVPGTPTGVLTAPYTNAVPLVPDTTGSKLWAYIGGVWKCANFVPAAEDLLTRVVALEAGGGGGGSGVVISDTEPASPTAGMEWFHTTSGIQYTRVGTAWVEPGGQQIVVAGGGGGSVSPILSWMI